MVRADSFATTNPNFLLVCKQSPTDNRVKYRDILTRGKVKDHYRPGRQLGAGNMATVYLYTRLSDNKPFAAKIVEKNSLSNQKEFTNELEILAHLRGHSHILQLEVIFFLLQVCV